MPASRLLSYVCICVPQYLIRGLIIQITPVAPGLTWYTYRYPRPIASNAIGVINTRGAENKGKMSIGMIYTPPYRHHEEGSEVGCEKRRPIVRTVIVFRRRTVLGEVRDERRSICR